MKHLLFVLFFFSCIITGAQSTLRGFIKDAETGEPLFSATVGLEGTPYGSQTDENGYFSINKIPKGTYTLFVSAFDHAPLKESITIEGDGKVLSRNILLKKKEIEIGAVEIEGKRNDQKSSVGISKETMTPQDIKRIPNIGGQPDLVQALTTLPGFVSTGDQGGQIFVRGGSPVQNKVFLDGMIVYNPFHSIGIYSVFDTEIISTADVYTSGFGAQYGGRISSIMDIKTRDGNKKEISGKVGINPVATRVVVEGPLKKLNENGGGISYILSAKRSHLDYTTKQFYPYINDGAGLPFSFLDLYGKVSFSGASGSKLNLFAFNFNDAVTNYKSLANFGWSNVGYGGNFVIVPSSSAVLISGNFANSRYRVNLDEGTLPQRYSEIKSFNLGLDFKYIMKSDVLNYGIEVVGYGTDYSTFSILDPKLKVALSQNNNELCGFFTYKINREKFVVEPGIRLQYYTAFGGILMPEPRFGFKYKFSERFRTKLALGRYSQNVISLNSDRDVVNLFFGYLTGPDELQDKFIRPNGTTMQVSNNRLQRAWHYVTGFEFDITEKINLNVEGYLRQFQMVVNQNRNKLFPDDQSNQNRPEVLRKDFIVESGWAAGTDMVLKYETKTTYLYLVYSLAKVRRWDGVQWYAPVFDRRHNVNFVASKKWGEKREWEWSVRWNLGSGLPFTQTQGYYQPPSITNGISTDYVNSNSNGLGVQYGKLNGGRLPYYHRLDLSVKRSFKMRHKITLDAVAGVSNAYNRANVFYIDRITNSRVDQLPILPTIGIDMSF